jgi:hypothetical protein
MHVVFAATLPTGSISTYGEGVQSLKIPLKSYIATHLKTSSVCIWKKCGVYFVNMATAFGRLPITSEVYRLMFKGVSRRRSIIIYDQLEYLVLRILLVLC